MSTGATEGLVIPIRMDKTQATEGVKGLERETRQATGEMARDFRQVKGEVDKTGQATRDAGSELASFLKTGAALAGVKNLAAGFAAEMDRISERSRQAAAEFANLQKSLQQVAALTGKPNTNQFTLEQVAQAQAAMQTPEEWRRAQEEFQSRAGAYLEGDQARLDQGEGAAFQGQIAAFAKARGIPASEAMALGGGLLQFSEGKQDVGALMDRFGKVFKTLERAPTPVAQLLPQMSRIMSQGFAPEQAAQALAIMSEAMPGEEETGVENALKALTEARLKGKGGELGINDKMTPMQQLEAASRRLKERVAKGENIDELLKEYAPDLRERRGLLGFMSRGVGAQGFERVRGYAAETPADFTQRAIEEYKASTGGQRVQEEVGLAAAQARRGARTDFARRALMRAETTLSERGELEQPGWGNFLAGIPARLGLPGWAPMEQQQIQTEAIRQERAKRGEPMSASDYLNARNAPATDAVFREMQQQTKLLQEMNERDRARDRQGPALAAPMPQPPGRF